MRKKQKLFIWLLLTFVLSPYQIHAEDVHVCDYKEKARHNLIASNIDFELDYVEKADSVEFFITIYNLHPEIKIIDTYHNEVYQYNNLDDTPKEIKIGGYKDGNIVKFEFYSQENICQVNLLSTKHINLPSYNKYYKDSLCKGIEENMLCKKWVKNDLSYEKFKEEVRKYKDTLKKAKKNQEESPKEESKLVRFIETIIKFAMENYIYILISIIILGSLSIIIIYKKQEFRF